MRTEERLRELLDAATPPTSGISFDDVARRARRRRTTRWSVATSAVAVAALVAGVMLAGTSGAGRVPRLTTKPTPTTEPPTNLVSLTRDVRCPQKPTAVPRDRLRAFHAVTVVTCGRETRELGGEGQWLVDVRRVATGGVVALQAAFERPDDPPTNGACSAVFIGVPPLILVDSKGHELVPTAPVDQCRQPQKQLLNALGSVTWQTVSVHKVRQTVTPQAEAANCPMQWKNENWLYGHLGGTHRSAGGRLFENQPVAVHVCVYRVRGTDLEVGDFERGFTLSAADTRKLLAALDGPGPTRSCPGQREFAVVSGSQGQDANVELGGCWRVQRPYPNAGVGSADGSVVRALLTAR